MRQFRRAVGGSWNSTNIWMTHDWARWHVPLQGTPVTGVNTSPVTPENGEIFGSYAALALALLPDITGACLLDATLRAKGEYGDLSAATVARCIRFLSRPTEDSTPYTTTDPGTRTRFTAIPLTSPAAAPLGVFCVRQHSTAPAGVDTQAPASAIAHRLKPLLDCITRELKTTSTAGQQVKQLTERSADLEWLFKITAGPHAPADNRRLLEELLQAASQRMESGLAVLSIPDKRVTIMHDSDKSVAGQLRAAWSQTNAHLMAWVQRQHKPLIVNRVGHGKPDQVRCKVLCVPLVRENDRIIGTVAFFNGPLAPDFPPRLIILAQHIARQASSIVEAQFDLMTGLYTRTGLDQMVVPEDEASQSDSSVLYVDIDHMHILNELHSFDLGNELIIRIADLLAPPLLPTDALAARISGDRFAVVLPKCGSKAAVAVAEQLQAAAAKISIGPSKETFDISISTGISALLPMPDGLARGIAAAEIACKTAKKRGRNRIEVYTFEDTSMMRRHADALAVGQLRSALKQDRLLLFAQRIIPLQNKALPGGYEILLRLKDVDGSLVAPGPLIEAAQRYQILPSVDRWVMLRALEMLCPFRGMLRTRELGMSINVSGQSMGDEAFVRQFTQALQDANLPKNCVSVELTEQAAISNISRAGEIVNNLGKVGCRFALDDFGTGSNSLTVLKALQIYRVKIDGSFVRDVLTNRNSQATVRGLVELSKGIGIETVAEYVESLEIAQELTRLGVDYAQGYAFSRPEPLSEVLAQLASDESQRLHRLFLET